MAEQSIHNKKATFSYGGELEPIKRRIRNPRLERLIKKILIVCFVIVVIAAFTYGSYIFIATYIKPGKLGIKSRKPTPTIVVKSTVQKLSPEKEAMLKTLQQTYTMASASAQGAITTVDAGKQEVELDQKINNVLTHMLIKVADKTIIYERPFKATDQLKILAFKDLTVGRYIVVSGGGSGSTVDATVITVDPVIREAY